MNLSVCADDIETGMTHIIRAKEHEDNARRQEMIFKVLGKPFPWTVFLGRYKFTDLAISKTKTKKLIKEGKFSGWDDIRLPFLNVLKRRGYQPGAFAKFAEQRGLSGVDKVMTQKDFFQILDNFNRDIIKDISKKMDFSEKKEKDKDKITILMPDNTKKEIFTSLTKLKEGDLVYFANLGYVKLDDKKKKVFWFCHN
jgi:glutamyl/glutaminyl-tRNA synthetase